VTQSNGPRITVAQGVKVRRACDDNQDMAHTEVALDAHSRVESTDSRLELFVREGEQLFADGNMAEAEKQFHRALEICPTHGTSLNNLGVIAFKTGKREAAIALFTRALVADPGMAAAAENIVPVLAQIPEKDLVSVGRYAFPYLILRLTSDNWDDTDSAFLNQAITSLDESQIETLLDHVLAKKPATLRGPLLEILNATKQLGTALLKKIGDWYSAAPLCRRDRDEFELLICQKGRDDKLVVDVANREGYYREGFFAPGWERYPRRIVKQMAPNDPFMKEVPAGTPSKTGGMRILIVSDFNIAGQCTALMRALNKYTNHAARCVILQDDYLSYDKDILITNQQGISNQEALAEACQLMGKADFFHFGRGLFEFPGVDWNKLISPQNCVFQYYGSELRDNGKQVAEFHARTQFPAITAVDLTMYRLLPASYYHIQPYMLEMDQQPQVNWDNLDRIRICHAPSSANYRKIKRTDLILETMNRLAAEHANVDSVLIENVTNAECMRIKSSCHVHIVSLLTVFGLNAIESAAMGLAPICGVDNFSRLIYPESPVPNASADNLYEVVKDLVLNPTKARETGLACREWVRPLFDARYLVQKYWYLYDVIYNGLSVDYPELFR
jgi:tetratricopeptide (TPR) repeat protein